MKNHLYVSSLLFKVLVLIQQVLVLLVDFASATVNRVPPMRFASRPNRLRSIYNIGILTISVFATDGLYAADLYVKSGGGCAGSPCYSTIGAAVAAATAGDVIHLESDITEGIVTVNKAITIHGHGFKLTSTSVNYGVEVTVAGVTIQDLIVEDAGTFGIHASCGSDNLALTDVTVDDCGGTGIALNGSDNCVLTNITSTNNTGNGISVTNCDNLTINGITTSGNAFGGGFSAGIGLFTSAVTCPPAGISDFELIGAVSIGEPVKVYSGKANAADVITISLTSTSIQWAVGTSALDRSYWPDKATAYAVVDALFEPPYSYPNTTVFVEEVATDNLYVDDDPNGDATPAMLIQTAINFAAAGKTIFLETGLFKEKPVIDKSLTLDGNGLAFSILDGTTLGVLSSGTGGITINSGITNVTIKELAVKNYTGAGGATNGAIYAVNGNNNLVIQDVEVGNNPSNSGIHINATANVDNVLIDGVIAHDNTGGARGIVIWNGAKTNITIQNCEVYNNNCCGIELQDGTASGVTMSNNNVYNNTDSGMSAVGLTGPGENVISNNTLSNNGRFGIEIKMPNGTGLETGAGRIVVENNSVVRTIGIGGELRDIAAIAVFRRGALVTGNVNIPTGVVVKNNTVSGYQQPSTSDGFGIVIEGTNHNVYGNTVNKNDVGIQQQAGHTPYTENLGGDAPPYNGDQSNLADQYFGRGNTPFTCGNTIGTNTYGAGANANGTNTRNVGAGVNLTAGVVLNDDTDETFCSIQKAIDDSHTLAGHTILAEAGTYNEDVTVNKQLTISGAGIDVSYVTGPIGGGTSTFQVAASGVIIEGFTISRAGNNTTDWNAALNLAGIAVQGQTADMEVRECKITGNRNGIDVNNSNDNNIHNNIITFNRTGLIFRNQTDNTILTENEITDNWTMGVLFLDASGGTNSPLQQALNSTFEDNDISGNWYGDIVDRQSGGSLPAPGTTNLKNFECNWYGVTSPVLSTANSTEPGYSALIPVAYGGSSTPPGGQPNILGPASANFDYVNWLVNGTDNDGLETGFQPVPMTCTGDPIVIASAVTDDVICGETTGSITVTFSGGTAPYDIAWSGAGSGSTMNISSPHTIPSLAVGAYTITITDDNGTTATASASVLYLPVKNLTGPTYHATIQAGVTAAANGDVLEVCAGTYTEVVTVNKDVTINGLGNPTVTAPAGSNQKIFTITAAGATLDGFNIEVNRPNAAAGVYAENIDNITVQNCTINSTGSGSTLTTPFGNTDAAGIALLGNGGPIEFCTLDNNDITAGSGPSVFSRGIWLREMRSTVTDNEIVATTQDLLCQFASGGTTTIDGNTFTGAGLDITEPNNNPSTVNINNNTFQPASPAFSQSLMIKHNYTGVPVNVTNNQFLDHGNIAILSGSSKDVTISGNTFTPAAAAANFSHILFSTSYPTGGTPIALANNGISIQDNTFNDNGAAVGRAIDIQNGQSLGSGYGTVSVGSTTANTFGGTLDEYIRLTTGVQAPNYSANPNPAPANISFDASNNTYGGTLPNAMSFAQLFAVEDKVYHRIDESTLGFVTIKASNAYVTDNAAPTATNNDYTRIRNAVALVAGNSWSVNLKGSFDWTEANAAAAWALGNDGVVSAADDYSILVPANLNGVTFTAPEGLGTASIQGPGDLASVNLEGVLIFDGGDNQNWTISNMEFLDFDLSIGMFNGAGGTDAFNSTTITNNTFDIATDLNATVAPADVNQNIGIHFSFGTNQTISNNTFNIAGDGVSDGVNYSTSVGMQSNTSGGNVYNGLMITGNTINIQNAQSANPQVVLGIWENSHGHTGNVTVSNNQFLNLAGGNDPALNLQRAFRVTSHSGATSTVTYSNNTVQGANIGFQWISGSNFSAEQPVQMTGNTLNDNNIGVLVQSNGKATLTNNDFDDATDNTTDVQIQAGSVVTSAGGNSFGGETYYVENLSATAINVTGDNFDQANNFRRSDRIYDALDNNTSGLVTFDANDHYVSAPGTGSADETIPNAIGAAAGADAVHIETGTYATGIDATSKDIKFVPGSSPGCVTLNGNMVLNAGDVLDMEINGATACTDYDQFTVNGTVTLGNATLTLTLGYTPALNDQFTLIANDGADAVSGIFAQGYSITVGGHTFDINYAGGDGNDVVLTKCSGGVVNSNTGDIFCSIQDAIDDPQTLNNHTITVAVGTYSENITVNKGVSLSSANNTNIPCTGARGAESIIAGTLGSGTATVTIAADNVNINGFTITNTNGSYGIWTQGRNNLDIKYNIITNIGNNTTGSGASYGVAVSMGSSANMDDVIILGNCISDIRGGENTSLTGAAAKANNGSGVGIGAGFSTASYDITNLSITENTIDDITACTDDFNDGGKGAYGVLINVGANASYNGKAVSPLVQNNEITDLSGHWSHGVGLEGETPGAMVKNNKIDNLTDTKGNTDAIGVLLEQNDGAATVVINDNSFTNMPLNVKNLMTPFVDATCNWHGSASSGVIAGKISGNVTYSPWLINGTDNSGATGFQPVPLACGGTPVVISSAVQSPQLCASLGSITVTFSGGTGPYNIAWTGGGPVIGVTSPYIITGLTAGLYSITVTDSYSSTGTSSATVLYHPVTNTTQATTHATIQDAIDAATPNDILEACAGTYPELITVNKALTINGPQDNVDADTRFAAFTGGPANPKANPSVEAIITAPTNNPLGGNPGANDLIRVLASGVTINGFVIDGNNPALGASAVVDGVVDIHARRGITNIDNANGFNPLNNLSVQYNIIQNVTSRGVSLANNGPLSTGCVITENVIRKFGSDPVNGGQGVILFTNAYADVTNNTVDVPTNNIGLHLQNFYSNGSMSWSGNNVTVGQDAIGIHANLFYAPTATLTISGNTVNAASGVTGISDYTWGINVWSVQVGSTVAVTNNTVGSSGGEFGRGINLWNLPTTNTVAVSGGTVGNSVVGINLDNIDPYFGAGSATTANVTTTALTGNTIGIRARAESLTPAPGSGSNVVSGNVTLNLSGVAVDGGNFGIQSVAPSGSAPYTATVVVDNDSEVKNAATAGILVSGAQAFATVQNNDASIFGNAIGIDVDGGSATVTNNHIYDNGIGVRFTNAGTGTVNNLNNFDGGADPDNGRDIQATASAGIVTATPNNSFAGDTYGVENLSAMDIDATLNYWESPSGPGPIGPGTGANITTKVLFCPWLNAAPPGGVATGLVLNTTTLESFCTIQAAIDDAQTLDGHTLSIAAGIYPERVNVTKQLTLQGAGEAMTILDGTGLPGLGSGISIPVGVINVKIYDFTVRDYAGNAPNSYAGIYANGQNNGLVVEDVTLKDNVGGCGFYANGPVNGITLNNLDVSGHTAAFGAARGIVIWNGLKQNITITNCDVYNNNCCGIELQDGSASDIDISNNNVHDNWDNGIGLVGLNGSIGANTVANNTVTDNGRFGIEIKNPDGNGSNITVNSNIVTLTGSFVAARPSEERDLVGIAAFRRGWTAGNVDIPTGVTITGNTVSGYVQDNGASTSEGFGIVVEGTNHTVTGNTVTGNDIGIQQQAGHLPYIPNAGPPTPNSDGDQSDLADQYFGRGNSPVACGNDISGNTLSGNGDNSEPRNVGAVGGAGFVTNTNTGETFCSIQAAINDSDTDNGDVITVGPGTFNENVVVNKELTITGAGNGSNPATNTVLASSASCTGTGFTISAANVTIQNMYVTDYQNAVVLSGVVNPTINNMALIDYCVYGVRINGTNSSVDITQTDIQRTTPLAGTVGIRAGTADAVNGMLIDDCTITGNTQGMAIFQSGTPVAFDNITIKNSTISNNLQKGLYFEKLSNALLENLTMDNNGTDATYGFNNGIDINLKYDDYSNITIKDCDITNSGATGTAADPQNPAAIAIKARDDSPSYNGNPATLDNVLIKNNLITGPRNGIRFGEFGTTNATPTNVTVEGNDLSYAFANKAVISRINSNINLLCNWHGSTDILTIWGGFAQAGSGQLVLSSVLNSGTDGSAAVGFQPSGTCVCASGNLVTNTNSSETFCTIQAAIDDADTDPGDIITVGPGTYVENILVHKEVKLRGNNYGINPNTGSRIAESIIVPATSDPDPNSLTAVNIMYLTAAASGSEIDGFTFDGDNTSLTSAVNINGANIDAIEALSAYDGTGNLTISNNIVKNLSYAGMDFYNYYNSGGVTTDNYITNNKIDNIEQSPYGIGVLIYNNFYADITDNVMTRVRVGVQTGNFYSANTGSTQTIGDNEIKSSRRGIFHNLAYGSASAFNITNNIITTTVGAANHLGISLSSIGGTVGVNVSGNDIDGAYAGVDFWNCESTNTVTVNGGNITNCQYGVFASNYDGYASNANTSTVAISGVTVTGATTAGVYVKDNPLNSNNADITLIVDNDCEINGTGQLLTGILVEGSDAHATVQYNDASINGFAIGIDVDGGSATITNNHIYDNGIGVRFTNGGTGDVNTNKFYDALPNGTDIQATASAGAVTATPNNWLAGSAFGVENLSATSIDATENYWNDPSGPGLIAAGSGAKVTTNVDYCPWLGDEPTAFGGTGIPLSSPTVTITVTETSGTTNNDGTICNGDNVTLDATIAGATAYLWSPGGAVTPSINVAPGSSTLYTVTVTFAGCQSTDDQQIIVDPLPSATITADAVVCGNSMGNVASVPDAGMGATYVWSITGGSITAGAGTNSITYTANMSGTITFNVTVTSPANCTSTGTLMTQIDNTPPVITCVGNQSVNTDAGLCTAVVTGIGPVTATDACPYTITFAITGAGATPASGNNDASGAAFNTGVSTVTYTITDGAGNTDDCSFTVTVTDAELPQITFCPSNTALGILDPRDPYATGWATATDNCPGVTVTYNDDRSGLTGCNATGTIVRTFTAKDASNNMVTCAQTLTIQDLTPPVLSNCPIDMTVNADLGDCDANVNYTDPTAVDVGYFQGFENAAFVSGSYTNQPSTDWNDYSSALSRVTSGTNGIASKTGAAHAEINSTAIPAPPFDYTGVFNRLGGYSPVFGTGFRASQDIYINLSDPAVIANTYGWDLSTAVSNQSNGHRRDFIFHSASNASGEVLIGASNNTNFTRRNDLGSINHYTITSSGWYTFEWVFRDNGGVLAVDLNLRDAGGALLWTETRSDASDLIATIVGGNRYMWFTFLEVDNLAIDNSLLERNATVACALPSGSAFPVGINTVTCTATDACSQTSDCMFDITVVDNQPPVVTCPAADVTIDTDDGLTCSIMIPDYIASLTPTDNCGPITEAQDIPAGAYTTGVSDGAIITVHYTATDAAMNTTTCTVNITVNDDDPPMVTCPPANVTIDTDDGLTCSIMIPDYIGSLTPTDNCSAITEAQSIPAGAYTTGVSDGAVIVVNYTATDGASPANTTTCTVNITVNDDDPPQVTCPPADITVNTDAGANCSIMIPDYIGTLTPTDNCSAIVEAQSIPAGAYTTGVSHGAVIVVNYTATDGASPVNTTTCTVNITVNDDDPPSVTSTNGDGFADIKNYTCNVTSLNIDADPSTCVAFRSVAKPTWTDNCDMSLTLTQGAVKLPATNVPLSNSAFAVSANFPVGTNVITFTATDDGGNTTTCSLTIVVADNQPPVISSCPSSPQPAVNALPGTCAAPVNWLPPSASDNCTGVSMAVTGFSPANSMTPYGGPVLPGSSFPVGTYTIVYTATDGAGLTATCTFNISVVDNQVPVIATCPVTRNIEGCGTGIITTPAFSTTSAVSSYAEFSAVPNSGSANDNCAIVSVTYIDVATGSCPIVVMRTWTVTDAAGLTAICTQTIYVDDTQDPVVTGTLTDLTVEGCDVSAAPAAET
ncbi:MAG: HYR domain-containing protein, partial [Haliscomenobacteraceae bacterium CHB4]|nr:HYR domain-containing protein [Haliscomenobacteraceae bacterium CHB4]